MKTVKAWAAQPQIDIHERLEAIRLRLNRARANMLTTPITETLTGTLDDLVIAVELIACTVEELKPKRGKK